MKQNHSNTRYQFPISRRQAIASSVFTAVSCRLVGAAAPSIPDALDIIDCHTHFYDPQRQGGVPWPNKGTSLYRTVLPEHLRSQKQYRPVTAR